MAQSNYKASINTFLDCAGETKASYAQVGNYAQEGLNLIKGAQEAYLIFAEKLGAAVRHHLEITEPAEDIAADSLEETSLRFRQIFSNRISTKDELLGPSQAMSQLNRLAVAETALASKIGSMYTGALNSFAANLGNEVSRQVERASQYVGSAQEAQGTLSAIQDQTIDYRDNL